MFFFYKRGDGLLNNLGPSDEGFGEYCVDQGERRIRWDFLKQYSNVCILSELLAEEMQKNISFHLIN